MAAVVEFVSGDRTLLLGNEQYIRPMSFGADWNHITILIRAAPYAIASFNWNLVIGVTANGRGYYAANSDCVGALWSQAVSYSAGPPPSFTWTWGSGATLLFTRTNNTLFSVGVGNSGGRAASVMPILNVWGVDIERAGNNTFSISHCAHGLAGGSSLSRSVFRESIHYDAHQPLTAATRNSFNVEVVSGISGYAGGGQLDSVLIKYGSDTQPLCISDIIVYKYY